MSRTLPSQRDLFDIPRDVVWLNCAYLSPLMRSVVEAGTAGLGRKAHPWTIGTDDFFDDSEALRAAWAELFGAPADDLALTPSAGYGLSLAARALPFGAGEEVLLAEDQFPSNVYPWTEKARRTGARVRFVPRPAAHDWTSAAVSAIGEKTAVVALPNIHWTDGGFFDLVRIGARAREVGAALVVDATQSLGVLPLDVGVVRPDFVAGASYKWLLGPYSLGYLYAAPHRQDAEPLEQNWVQRANAREFSRLVDYTDAWQAGARRLDCGERSNFALVPAALAAARKILEWKPENIASTLAPMTARLAEAAGELGFGAAPAERRAPHYLALALPPGEGAAGLARVQEALAERKVYVSVRGDTIRLSPHLYNDDQDLERFLDGLHAAF